MRWLSFQFRFAHDLGDGGGNRARYGRGRVNWADAGLPNLQAVTEGVHDGARGRSKAGGGGGEEICSENGTGKRGIGGKCGLIFPATKLLA
jgi:hypothetical protein